LEAWLAAGRSLLREPGRFRGRSGMVDERQEVLQYLDALLSGAPVGFALFDQDLRYVRINEALAEANGIPVDEHIGKRISDLLPDVPTESLERRFMEVMTTGEPMLNELVAGQTPARPGENRYWLVSCYPLRSPAGAVIGLGEFVVDVTEQRMADAALQASETRLRSALRERDALLQSEKRSRFEAEIANERLRTLQSITEAALAHLSLDALLKEMLDRVKRAMAVDTIAILLRTENEDYLRVSASAGFDQPLEQIAIPIGHGISGLIASTGRPLVLEEVEQHKDVLPPLRGYVRSLLGVPLALGEEVIGVLHVGTLNRRKFTSEEMDLVKLVADRVALAVDRARIYEREHRIAETLQRSLLPAEVPDFPGVTAAVRYLPGGHGINVGGDWYDVMRLADDKMAVVIGDVVGRGMKAASLMGQMRSALRAYALEGHAPGDVVQLLDAFVENMRLADMTTIVYAEVALSTRRVSLVCAGHPPPLLIVPGREPAFLEGAIGPPLGITFGQAWPEHRFTIEPGSTLLLYTDGLVEQRGADIADGLEKLRSAAAGHHDDVEDLCDHVLRKVFGDEESDDDVALVALRVVD
jgi:PAS domain S-box-containing protein